MTQSKYSQKLNELVKQAFAGDIEAQKRISLKILKNKEGKKFGSWVVNSTLYVQEL